MKPHNKAIERKITLDVVKYFGVLIFAISILPNIGCNSKFNDQGRITLMEEKKRNNPQDHYKCLVADNISYSKKIFGGGWVTIQADLVNKKIVGLVNEELIESANMRENEIRDICTVLSRIDFDAFQDSTASGKDGAWHKVIISKDDSLIVNSIVWSSYYSNEHDILWGKLFDTYLDKVEDDYNRKYLMFYKRLR